jgi:hypothetical protein
MVYLGSNVYSFNVTLPAGSFYWKSYANDTLSNSNSTQQWEFTVSKNSSVVAHLYFNGSDSDTSFNASQTINITGVLTGYSYDLTIHLDLNGSDYGNNYQNGTNSVINYTKLIVGVYNVTAHFDGDQNYSDPSVTHYLTITENLPTYSHLKSSPTTPVTYSPNGIYYFNSTWLDADAITFEWNGTTNYTVTTESGNEYYINITDLSASNYTYRWLANNTNSWTTTALYTYDVHDYPRWSSNSSNTSDQYNPSDSTFNITLTLNNTEISTSLLEINLSTPTNFTMSNSSKTSYYYQITLGAGSYRWKVYANNTQGFWNGTDYCEFTILQNSTNPVHLSLSYSGNTYTDSNTSTYSDVTVTATPSATYDQSGTVNLFYDGNAVSYPHTTTHGVGTHIYKVNITENTNYTSNSTGLTFYLTILSPPSSGVSNGGGGGGGGLGPVCVPKPENCTDKIDNDCDGATDCADADCSRDLNCKIEMKELNFTLSTDTIEIEQGSDGIVLASLLNNGNVPLLLNSSLEKECCNISTPIGFELKVKEETQFSVNVHIPLYQKEGEYTVKVKLSSGPLTKEKAFKIIVKKSPSIIKLEELEKRLTELGSTVTDYQVVGLSVGGLMKTVDESKSDIDTAKTAIENDDLNALQNYISKLEEKVNSLSSTLPGFGVQKFLVNNKWNITDGVLLIVASVYLVTQVLIPYVKLTAEMTKLRFEELAQSASRKKTETQYFFRKIDEQTFRKIVSEKHSQVLKLQSTITLKKQQRSDLIRKKLNPLSLVEFIKTKTAKKKT